MLATATVGFAITFWAWALLSPLGPKLKDSLHLSSFQQSLVVAVPVIRRRPTSSIAAAIRGSETAHHDVDGRVG
jgi:hypothetical protein